MGHLSWRGLDGLKGLFPCSMTTWLWLYEQLNIYLKNISPSPYSLSSQFFFIAVSSGWALPDFYHILNQRTGHSREVITWAIKDPVSLPSTWKNRFRLYSLWGRKWESKTAVSCEGKLTFYSFALKHIGAGSLALWCNHSANCTTVPLLRFCILESKYVNVHYTIFPLTIEDKFMMKLCDYLNTVFWASRWNKTRKCWGTVGGVV